MRGADQQQSHIFSYVSPEERVRKDHPLRTVRAMVDEVLKRLSRRFDTMYAKVGRPSIPPEQMLRAQLLQLLYSIRSERLLMEEIDYSVLFRWFIGLNLDDEVWDATVFTKNRDRLLEGDVAKEFLAHVVEQARGQGLPSDEHFTVDGTLLEAWAGAKSFHPTVNFRGGALERSWMTGTEAISKFLPPLIAAGTNTFIRLSPTSWFARFVLTRFAELEAFMPVGPPSDSPEYRHIYRRVRCVTRPMLRGLEGGYNCGFRTAVRSEQGLRKPAKNGGVLRNTWCCICGLLALLSLSTLSIAQTPECSKERQSLKGEQGGTSRPVITT
jgi:transposase